MEAEVSLSLTIVVPFINDKGYYRLRVRTLLDPGIHENGILEKGLKKI